MAYKWVRPVIVPAPDFSKMRGPSVEDDLGKRIGQLVYEECASGETGAIQVEDRHADAG